MRITIEFDPIAGTAKVTNSTSAEVEAVPQMESPPTTKSAARDAGMYLGVAPGERPSAVPSLQALSAGIATATASAPPPPHLDTFDFLSGVSQSEGGIDAGAPKMAEPR